MNVVDSLIIEIEKEIEKSKEFRKKHNLIARWYSVVFQPYEIFKFVRYRWRGFFLSIEDLDAFWLRMSDKYVLEEYDMLTCFKIDIHWDGGEVARIRQENLKQKLAEPPEKPEINFFDFSNNYSTYYDEDF